MVLDPSWRRRCSQHSHSLSFGVKHSVGERHAAAPRGESIKRSCNGLYASILLVSRLCHEIVPRIDALALTDPLLYPTSKRAFYMSRRPGASPMLLQADSRLKWASSLRLTMAWVQCRQRPALSRHSRALRK